MRRVQIYLTNEQIDALNEAASRSGLSRSALVRAALGDRYKRRPSRDEILRALRESFGAWKGRDADFDAEKYVDELRSGRRLRELYADGDAASGGAMSTAGT
jgi:hypothetical protein